MRNVMNLSSSLLLRDLCGLCVNPNDVLVRLEAAEFAEVLEGRGSR